MARIKIIHDQGPMAWIFGRETVRYDEFFSTCLYCSNSEFKIIGTILQFSQHVYIAF
jgi:hypothetical protein